MDIDKVDIHTLFDKTQRYLVPLFQRSYVWGEAGQWQPLWEDIIAQVNFSRAATTRSSSRHHFLGALVLNQTRKPTRRIAAYEVIDGQQRLTTLQILLAAFRDVVASSDNSYLSTTLARLTANARATDDENEVFKVWPTNVDRPVFASVMSAGSKEEVLKRFPLQRRRKKYLPRPQLVEAYHFFYNTIDAYLRATTNELPEPGQVSPQPSTDSAVSLERAEELLEVLKSRLLFVEIELDASEDPQVIFETLNARGEPLLASDLVRNFVFLRARDSIRPDEQDVDALYNRWWLPFEEEPGPLKSKKDTGKFWKDEEKRGRIRRSRLDLFVFQYLTYQTGEEIKIEHLFAEFRDWWESEDRSVTGVLRELRALSEPFKELLLPNRTTHFGVFADRLRILDQTTPFPLLLYLAQHQNEIEATEFAGILRDIESYLVRREVCGLTKKNYNHTFLQLLRALRQHPRPSREALRTELLALQGDSVVWPDDRAFGVAFLVTPMYQRIGPAKTRMVLAALDLDQHTSKQERIHLDDELTVEHVRPQSATTQAWPSFTPKEGSDTTGLELSKIRDQLTHSIGNLTLLTQPLNSSVRDGPFSAKRPAIAAQSRLVLNSYFQQFTNDAQWNEQQIIDRGQKLFEVAKRIWPRPSASPTTIV